MKNNVIRSCLFIILAGTSYKAAHTMNPAGGDAQEIPKDQLRTLCEAHATGTSGTTEWITRLTGAPLLMPRTHAIIKTLTIISNTNPNTQLNAAQIAEFCNQHNQTCGHVIDTQRTQHDALWKLWPRTLWATSKFACWTLPTSILKTPYTACRWISQSKTKMMFALAVVCALGGTSMAYSYGYLPFLSSFISYVTTTKWYVEVVAWLSHQSEATKKYLFESARNFLASLLETSGETCKSVFAIDPKRAITIDQCLKAFSDTLTTSAGCAARVDAATKGSVPVMSSWCKIGNILDASCCACKPA